MQITGKYNGAPTEIAADSAGNLCVNVQVGGGGGGGTTQLVPGTSGGCKMSHSAPSSTTPSGTIKGSAGQLYGLQLANTGTSDFYFRLYDAATPPAAGTTGEKKVIRVPASATLLWSRENGVAFSTGMVWTITGGMADNDTTPVAASTQLVDADYD